MKLIIVLLFIPLLTLTQDKNTYNWQIEKKSIGVDFTASGNEPFWSIEIYSDTLIKFSRLSEGEFLFGNIIVLSSDKNSISYSAMNSKAEIKIELLKQKCDDTMADKEYPYTVKVFIRPGKSNIFKEYSGCGMFLPDFRLNDTWVLEKINGRDIPVNDMKKVPYSEFNVQESRVAGTMGCNRYFGHYEIQGNKLTFGIIASTMMACEDMSLEREFLNTVNENTFYLEFEKNSLVMKNESGEEILKYKKTD